MPVIVTCPSCSAKLKAPDHLAGKTLPCPKCKVRMAVPRPRPDPEEDHVQAVAPATRPCPFCAEPVRVEAKKCRHCSELLDPTLRAAQAAPAPRPALADPDDDAPRRRPARRPSAGGTTFSLGGGCLMVILILVGLALVGSFVARRANESELAAADRLYDAGRRGEAADLYKSAFSLAGDRKPLVLQRIVEGELSRNMGGEAERWVAIGVKTRVPARYELPAAQAMLAKAEKARDDEARAREAEQKAAREEAARRGGDGGQPQQPRRGVTRANYERVQIGMSLAEVQDILGPGKETVSADNLQVRTWQGGIVFPKVISITFEDGVVSGKGIID